MNIELDDLVRVTDGYLHGCEGEVIGITTNSKNEVIRVLVKFTQDADGNRKGGKESFSPSSLKLLILE